MPKYDLNISPEYVKINGLSQWFHYFGTNGSKPIILFLHGGPGTPETPFIEKYNKNLMEDFIIVCWEQRGAGKSYSFRIQDTSMNMEQFIDDAHKATQYLKNKFDREKIYLMGHSWGTLLGIRTINKHPDDYLGYFAIAQTSNSYEEEMVIHNWLIKQATAISHKKALRQLAKICTPQKDRDISFSDIATKTKWVNYFGGLHFIMTEKHLKNL